MTPARRTRGAIALTAVLSVAFAILAHAAILQDLPPAVGALLSLVPLALLAAWWLRRHRGRIALALVAAAVVAACLGWGVLQRHFPGLFFLEHAGSNLLLAFVFGRTLAPGREALVTTFARILHTHLPVEVERYTRKVTLAWTILFAALATASAVLYLGGYLEAWSMLVNFVSAALIGTMFVVEYLVRLRALPDWERVGLMGGVRAFSRHFAARGHAPH